MNLSEALDAALPELPKARLTRVRPPRVDPELIVRDDTLDGEPVVGAFQRGKGSYFRFSPAQWRLTALFDGERSYGEIAALFNEQTGAQMAAEEVRLFAQNMDEAEFWYQTPQEKNIALSDKLAAERHRRAKRKSKINIAHISFSAWDPDTYLTWLDGKIGALVYNKWCALGAVLLFCVEGLILLTYWNVIGPDIPLFYNFTKKSFMDIVQFWVLFLLLGFLHESAHGLTCKHYGGEVHKMGLMLIYLTPAFYVDITEIWISATKIQRLATIIAGIWSELILCGVAIIVWTNTQPGQWSHEFTYEIILLTGVAVVVVNLNPLIKLDGYYFLTELIGVPDLKERSTGFLSGWFQSRVLRLPVEIPVVSRKRVPLFVLYAFVSGLYSYLLLFTVIRFTYNIAFNWLAEFALIPAGLLAFTVFRSRLNSLRDVIRRRWTLSFGEGFRLTPAPVLVVAILLALFFLPIFRDREHAMFLVEPYRSAVLHAPLAGRVENVLVHEGDHVTAGQPMLRMQSAIADAQVSSASAQGDAARFQVFSAEVGRQSVGSAGVDRDAAAHAAVFARNAQSSLSLSAPADGIVMTADTGALVNQNVGPGQALLAVAEAGPQFIRVFVPVSALDRIPSNAEIALAPPGSFRILRLSLPPLEGDAVPLPQGLVLQQDYKGLKLPTFYYARIVLPPQSAGGELPLGMSGEAKIFGARRSLFQRAWTVGLNTVRAHVW